MIEVWIMSALYIRPIQCVFSNYPSLLLPPAHYKMTSLHLPFSWFHQQFSIFKHSSLLCAHSMISFSITSFSSCWLLMVFCCLSSPATRSLCQRMHLQAGLFCRCLPRMQTSAPTPRSSMSCWDMERSTSLLIQTQVRYSQAVICHRWKCREACISLVH